LPAETLSPSKNLERQDIEWKKCQSSLLYYLNNYVKVQDSVNQSIISWRSHHHLLQLIELIQQWSSQPSPRKPLYIVIFKSRQVYTTTTLAGVANWLCSFFESTRVLELSKKEGDASEFLDKSRFINLQHPDFLRLKMLPDQASIMGFPATHSRIKALPATDDAGRSTDATMVVSDEWEYHPFAEDNFAAVKPTIDKGGIFIGASTVDKTKMDSFPKSIWRGAKSDDNNFISLFWDYFVVPGRNEETWLEDTKGLADWQKEGEYPRNEEEALSAPLSTCYFNRDAISAMFSECREPLEERHGGLVKIYRKSVAGRKYAFAIDSSEGQYDPTAGIVSDWRTYEGVAALHGKIPTDQLARLVFEIYEEYNHAYLGIERNAAGVLLIEKLQQMGVRPQDWYYVDKAKKKAGWWTSGTQGGGGTRPVMLADLAEDISERHIIIPMRDALAEFLSFSWVAGKPQAVRGAHDDWVMAHAILGQIRKKMTSGEMRVTSWKI